MGKSIGLLIATGRAQPFVNFWWADGQFDTAGAQTNRLSIPVPRVSPAHQLVVVQVFGVSSDETGIVTIRATLGGMPDEDEIALANVEGYFEGSINAFADSGEEYVQVDTEGVCAIFGIAGWVVDLTTGDYPDADDALPTGPIGDCTPVDDAELAEDEPLDSGLVHELRETLDSVRMRERQVMAVAGIKGTDHKWALTYPTRQPVMLPLTRNRRNKARVLALITNDTDPTTGEDLHVLIDLGDGGMAALFDVAAGGHHGSVVRITASKGSGTEWYELEGISMRPAPGMRVPPNYRGIAQMGAYVAGVDYGSNPDLVVHTLAIIETPEVE